MSIEKLQAVGQYTFVILDNPDVERSGFIMPEASLKKPNTGEIISVGNLVADKNIKKGRKAVFNKGAGSVIEIFDVEIKVLNEGQILGVI